MTYFRRLFVKSALWECNMTMNDKFFYFGFGSNMLAKRIQIQNPSARRVGGGKLDDYRLDFHTSSHNWLGAPATIVPSYGSSVYGAIWEIDKYNMKDLDNQEGVHEGIYKPITVSVFCLDTCSTFLCRAYHLNNQPQIDLKELTKNGIVPFNRQPSKTYLKTLVKGAIETKLPSEYIESLRKIKHNDNLVKDMEHKLQLDEIELY